MSIHYDDAKPSYEAAVSLHGGVSSPLGEEFARFLHHAEHLQGQAAPAGSLREWLNLAEAWRITQALRECRGNRSAAARKLRIGRRTLYAKMDRLRITPSWKI